jgi:hypothetical protein
MASIDAISRPQIPSVTGGQPESRAAPASAPESLLPAADGTMTQFTDPAVVIAFLAEQAATKERDAQDTLSRAYDDALARREQEEIDAMTAEASTLMVDAAVTGSLGVAAGAAQFSAALATPTTNAADAPKTSPGPGAAKNLDVAAAKPSRTPELLRATGKFFDASKDGVGILFKSSTEEDEIDLKRATFSAQLAQRGVDDARRAAGEYEGSIARALEYVKAFLEMRHQTSIAEAQRG